ncbi:MAG: site-specific DNA-methyltransferase [Nanoarchaeota archaeon]
MEKNGFIVKNVIVWDKEIHGLNYQNYAYTYEMIIFFVRDNYFPKNKPGNFYKDVWKIKRDLNNLQASNEETHHETIKQIEVVRKCILHGSRENDLILDPFIGSGTTAVACKQNNRNFIGFEIREDYIKLAQQKYDDTELNLTKFGVLNNE